MESLRLVTGALKGTHLAPVPTELRGRLGLLSIGMPDAMDDTTCHSDDSTAQQALHRDRIQFCVEGTCARLARSAEVIAQAEETLLSVRDRRYPGMYQGWPKSIPPRDGWEQDESRAKGG